MKCTRPRPKSPQESKLEMTPMIDVVFLLLIFFLCTLSFARPEGMLPQKLNDAGKAQERTPLEQVRLKIRVTSQRPARGTAVRPDLGDSVSRMQFTLNGRPVMRMVQRTVIEAGQPRTRISMEQGDPQVLVRRLQAIRRRDPGLAVIIDPDRTATYQAMIMALDACNAARFDKIRFAGKSSPR